MRSWEGVVELTIVKRSYCTVKAKNREEALRKFESNADEIETIYPCGCGCNGNSTPQVRKAHSIRLIKG